MKWRTGCKRKSLVGLSLPLTDGFRYARGEGGAFGGQYLRMDFRLDLLNGQINQVTHLEATTQLLALSSVLGSESFICL